MSPSIRILAGYRERIIWLLAAAILIAGYYFITQRFERKIQASIDASQGLYEKTAINRRMIAESGRATRLRNKLRRTLLGVFVRTTQPQMMATLLHDLDASSHAHHAAVLGIVPHTQGAAIQGAREKSIVESDPAPLSNTALDVSVRGTFTDLLMFLAQLSREHILLQVQDAQFSLSGAHHDLARPLLDARIHVLVYHLTSPQILGGL